MKYAILSLGGAIGMGLTAIASELDTYSNLDGYLGVSCGVMIIGLCGVIFPEIRNLWKTWK